MKTQNEIRELSEHTDGQPFSQLLLDIYTETYCKGCYAARQLADAGHMPWLWGDLLLTTTDELEFDKQFSAITKALPDGMTVRKIVVLEYLINAFKAGFLAAARVAEKRQPQNISIH